MTREEVIRLAKEADPGFDGGPDADGTMADSIVGIEAVERFAELVAAEYKRDAERYRWLRHNSGYSIRCRLFGDEEMYKHRDEHLDELIDAAMEKVK